MHLSPSLRRALTVGTLSAGSLLALAGPALASSTPEAVFDNSQGTLCTEGPNQNLGIALSPKPSPAATEIGTSGYEIAVRNYSGYLETTGSLETRTWTNVPTAGTSPAIAATANSNGYVVAINASSNHDLLFATATQIPASVNDPDPGVSTTSTNTGIPMAANASPSVATGSSVAAAFRNAGGTLEFAVRGGEQLDTGLTEAANTNPSIAYAANGTFVIAFVNGSGEVELTRVNTSSGVGQTTDLGAQAEAGTSPSVTMTGYSGSEPIASVTFANTADQLQTTSPNEPPYSWGVTLAPGTSPSTAMTQSSTSADTVETAYQGANGTLYVAVTTTTTVPDTGVAGEKGGTTNSVAHSVKATGQSMTAATSPAILGLSS